MITLKVKGDEPVTMSIRGETQVKMAVRDAVQVGASFDIDNETLILVDGILRVNTINAVEQDNTRPITSAAVFTTVGNISAILDTI